MIAESTSQRRYWHEGYVREGARALGPEMLAEGWWSIGSDLHDAIWWLHPSSQRTVHIGNYQWKNVSGIPAFHGPPTDPKTLGFVVACRIHDEHGNPIEAGSFWIESLTDALKWARRMRAAILAESPLPQGEQLTLDDLLARADTIPASGETHLGPVHEGSA